MSNLMKMMFGPQIAFNSEGGGGGGGGGSSSGGRNRDADNFAGSNYAPTSNAGTSRATQSSANDRGGSGRSSYSSPTSVTAAELAANSRATQEKNRQAQEISDRAAAQQAAQQAARREAAEKAARARAAEEARVTEEARKAAVIQRANEANARFEALSAQRDARRSAPTAAAAPQDKKPNMLGYGYYNNQGAWVAPSIDMKDGGGPGMAGEVFGSRGGKETDKEFGNNDGFLSLEEAEKGIEAGTFSQGLGLATESFGATPLGSGNKPTGLAKIAGNSVLGRLAGYDPDKVGTFGSPAFMTQDELDRFAPPREERSGDGSPMTIDREDGGGEGGAGDPGEVIDIEEDPVCPEGYMYDKEVGQCVIDPFQQPFLPLPPATGTPAVQAGGLSGYTAAPSYNLAALNPSFVAGQTPVPGMSGAYLPSIQGTLPPGAQMAGAQMAGGPVVPMPATPAPSGLAGMNQAGIMGALINSGLGRFS